MKKIYLFISLFFSIILLSGCTMDNTPTKKVENFLNKYRNLDNSVITQMENMINNDTLMTTTQKENYGNVLKRQYQDLTYTIKDERIDGDNATVTVEIEVYDFYKVTNDATTYYNNNPNEFADETGNLLESKFIDYRINKLKETTDKVKYTIDFTLTKDNDTWMIDDIDEITRQKIHGLYAY